MVRLRGLKKGLKKDEKGAIGIEILIVFIAIVLVAAVSAAVLIQTVGYLQQKATATGRETTQEVASGIKVLKVLGYAPDAPSASAKITKLAIYLEVNTGGQSVDLNATRLTLADTNKAVTLHYGGPSFFSDNTTGLTNLFSPTLPAWKNLTGTNFGIIVLQDDDHSLQSNYPVLDQGDKVVITVNATSIFGGLGPRMQVNGEVRPEFGAPGIIQFTTPAAYTAKIIELQ